MKRSLWCGFPFASPPPIRENATQGRWGLEGIDRCCDRAWIAELASGPSGAPVHEGTHISDALVHEAQAGRGAA